jgi:hypothetical protein
MMATDNDGASSISLACYAHGGAAMSAFHTLLIATAVGALND